ncbi:MAG: response regulator [Bacteroidota bacterium]
MISQQVDLLFIEDNPHEAELTIRNFKKYRLANNLVHIDDGAEALDFIFCRGKYEQNVKSPGPKLILLDLKLPKVGGHEILRQIRADARTRNTPVVVLTSSDEESDISECYRLGVNSYIVKPLDFKSLTNAITSLGMYWLMLNKPPLPG